jgi:ABC-type Fe3+-siderophore transport system permease subunit
LALLLAPVFWLLFLWVYYLSPKNQVIGLGEALAYMVPLACVCAYCVTLFVIALRASSIRPVADSSVAPHTEHHAQVHR